MTEVETFPHEFTCNWQNNVDGTSGSYVVRYRFVHIEAPEGWKTYPGQQCHDGKDGLLIQDNEGRWGEQDLWSARSEQYVLDIGCYGEKDKYVCDVHTPDWQGEHLERVEFKRAEDAAAWAVSWMTDPAAAVERINKEEKTP